MKYDVYIFDFGRVLANFDEDRMTLRYIPQPQDATLARPIIFDLTYWHMLDRGEISDSEVKEKICDRLPERLRNGAMQVYDNWYRMLSGVSGMKELVADLKNNGARLYLLSNISTQFAEHYTEVPELKALLGLFDGLVFSGPLGFAKPQKEIFEYLFNSFSLTPGECLFIDDNSQNIEAGRQLGLNTYLFDGSSQKLRNFIGI